MHPSRCFLPIVLLSLCSGFSTGVRAAEPVHAVTRPLKVIVLAGQSNMQGHAHVETVPAMRFNPEAAKLLSLIQSSEGTLRTSDRVWISSSGSAPEERNGIRMKKLDPADGQKQIDALYAATFNSDELEVLKKSTSKFKFHYLGSAGIMTQIGVVFADAA